MHVQSISSEVQQKPQHKYSSSGTNHRRWFAAGIRDIIWFRSFVPENDGQYAGAVILCIVVGIVASGLRILRSVMESRERIHRSIVRTPPTHAATAMRRHSNPALCHTYSTTADLRLCSMLPAALPVDKQSAQHAYVLACIRACMHRALAVHMRKLQPLACGFERAGCAVLPAAD
jgi:Ctr copper transporter family